MCVCERESEREREQRSALSTLLREHSILNSPLREVIFNDLSLFLKKVEHKERKQLILSSLREVLYDRFLLDCAYLPI